MRKFINQIKIPVCAVCFVLCLIFGIGLICLCNQPCGKQYTLNHFKTLNDMANTTFVFDQNTYTQNVYKNGELSSSTTYYYEIKDGCLYNSQHDVPTKTKVGTINAFELSVSFKTESLPFPVNATLICEQNIAQKNIYIAFTIPFAVMFIVFGILIIFVKNQPKQNPINNLDNK